MPDLWPKDIEYTGLKAPVTILREQASLLGKRTQNIVTAEVAQPRDLLVRMDQLRVINPRDPLKPKAFFYAFHLVAPVLGNYRYELFTIANDIRLYPVMIYPDEDILAEIAPDASEKILVAETEDEFVEMLSKILSSQKTKHVIQAILAQSTSLQPE